MLSSLRPTLRHRTLLVVALAGATLVARADIAVLREKGPHSGSAFSNPGLIADAPAGLKVAMKTADVKIHLRPGDGDTLKADVTADFEMDDTSPAELAGQLYLVGFPVTGLSSKIVTIDQFKVTVDGKEPAMVLRRAISISRHSYDLRDQPVRGALDARLAPKNDGFNWGIVYSDKSWYRASFAWEQAAKPQAIIKVQVAYIVTLRPQSVHYSKSYKHADADEEVVPFRDLEIDKWDDQYFFFDYVLLSGATWDGPINREDITLLVDRSLQLDPHMIEELIHHESVGFPQTPWRIATLQRGDRDRESGTCHWTLVKAKPTTDLLIAIPLSAIHRNSPAKKQ